MSENKGYFINRSIKSLSQSCIQYKKQQNKNKQHFFVLKTNKIDLMTFNMQQPIRTTQLLEDFHPIMRRRAYTSIRTSLPSYFSPQKQPPSPSIPQSQMLIYQSFSKINHIIDVVDDHIRRRIQCYENEVVNVVQKQIQQMRQQTQKVVIQLNTMIQQKNKQNEIWSLNNELDYFKSEAKKLFQMNRVFKKQNLEMKKRMQQYEWQLQNRQVIMQKLLYKYQKEKNSKNKIKNKLNSEIENIQKSAQKITKKKSIQQNKSKLSHPKVQIQDQEDFSIPEIRLDSFIKEKYHKKDNNMVDLKESEYLVKDERNFIENSILMIDLQDESEMSKIQFKGKSIGLAKPESKDQQSQVNIYLSEHSYKTLFEKKATSKKPQKLTKEIAIQTDNQSKQVNRSIDNRERRESQSKKFNDISPKQRQINFIKNGFTIRQQLSHKSNFRSSSNHQMNKTKRQNQTILYQMSKRKQRINTQTNFNRSPVHPNNQIQYYLLTPKPIKTNSKTFYKMANKFQRNKIHDKPNKIFDKVYENSNTNNIIRK